MKKTITLPDGSVEVVEGTAEEIASYEKARKHDTANESPAPKSKRKIHLTEEQKEQFRQLMRDEIQKQPVRYEFHSMCVGCVVCQPWRYTHPIWIAPVQPWIDPILPYVGDPLPGQHTISWTSDKVDLQPMLDAGIKPSVVAGGGIGNLPFLGTYSSQA